MKEKLKKIPLIMGIIIIRAFSVLLQRLYVLLWKFLHAYKSIYIDTLKDQPVYVYWISLTILGSGFIFWIFWNIACHYGEGI